MISRDITAPEASMLCSLCPVGAIDLATGSPGNNERSPAVPGANEHSNIIPGAGPMASPSRETGESGCTIDLGKCIFCRECEFALPGRIRFTNDYKLATNLRERLIVVSGNDHPVKLDPGSVRREILSMFGHALKLRQVSAAGDNSAEMELNAAGNVNFDMGRYGIEFVASPRHADGIVITGPISLNMAEALQICYDAIPAPKIIILAGTDAISGGLFSGSKALNREFLDNHPVDLYVPGNPPHPLTFINGILDLTGRK
ncbi:MAG: NADH:ubiquinone oxidoreductase [Deltaproteobacteria bacterium]